MPYYLSVIGVPRAVQSLILVYLKGTSFYLIRVLTDNSE